jgi:CDP-glycerol glycerophosphotransferase (TagB/SpsB family)
VDYLFLPGKNLATLFANTDISKQKFHITGSPKIDISLNNKTESKKLFLSNHNIPQTYKKYITVFTSFIDTNTKYLHSDPLFKDQVEFKESFNNCVIATRTKYQKALTTLAQTFPNYAFLIKPHPLEKETLSCTQDNIFLIQNAKAPDLFKVTDIAIHWLSTVALECWFHAIPVIEYFPVKQKMFLPDFHLGNPLYFTQKELLSGVQHYLTHPIEKKYQRIQKKYLEYSFFSLDGKSARRIAHVLGASRKNSTAVRYKFPGSLSAVGVHLLEKCMGVLLSRKLIAMLLPTFKAEYAIKNCIHEK